MFDFSLRLSSSLFLACSFYVRLPFLFLATSVSLTFCFAAYPFRSLSASLYLLSYLHNFSLSVSVFFSLFLFLSLTSLSLSLIFSLVISSLLYFRLFPSLSFPNHFFLFLSLCFHPCPVTPDFCLALLFFSSSLPSPLLSSPLCISRCSLCSLSYVSLMPAELPTAAGPS